MGSGVIKAGDYVKYIGWSTASLRGVRGTVCDRYVNGSPFDGARMGSYENVPVQFEAVFSRIFTAWAFNLKVRKQTEREPQWEV